jgi:hypothetical protein
MAEMAHRGVNYWLIDIPTGRGVTFVPSTMVVLLRRGFAQMTPTD